MHRRVPQLWHKKSADCSQRTPGANSAEHAGHWYILWRSRRRWFMWPNVRAKRATTAGRQARAGENAPCATGPGLVACRWRSA